MLPLSLVMYVAVLLCIVKFALLMVDLLLPWFRRLRIRWKLSKGAEKEGKIVAANLNFLSQKILLLLADRVTEQTFTALVKDLSAFVKEEEDLDGVRKSTFIRCRMFARCKGVMRTVGKCGRDIEANVDSEAEEDGKMKWL